MSLQGFYDISDSPDGVPVEHRSYAREYRLGVEVGRRGLRLDDVGLPFWGGGFMAAYRAGLSDGTREANNVI